MKKITAVLSAIFMIFSALPQAYAQETVYTELNKFATFTTDFKGDGSKPVTNLQITPGNANKYMLLSEKNVSDTKFPINIDIDFGGFQVEVEKLVFYSRFGTACGIKNIDILTMHNGQWTDCKTGVSIKWRQNAQTVEDYPVSGLSAVTDKLRIRINDANKASTEIRLDTLSVQGRIIEENAAECIRPVYFRSKRGYPVRLSNEVTVKSPDGAERKLTVDWSDIPDGMTEGSYTVKGTVTGSDIPVNAFVDVYEHEKVNEIGGWANMIYTAAKKAGYLTGITAGAYEPLSADEGAKIIAAMLNMDLAYPKD